MREIASALLVVLASGCATVGQPLREQASQVSEISVRNLGGGLSFTVPYTLDFSGNGSVTLHNNWHRANPSVREGRIAWVDFIALVDRLDQMKFFEIDPAISGCSELSDSGRIEIYAEIGKQERAINLDTSCGTPAAEALMELHQAALEIVHLKEWEPQLERFLAGPN
ncbi:MAG: hypothetical protein NDJ92_08495 [Thermoanaerobaculia bacterium]|nr:hypothetical protein [Thermoanaerobaculia bacterium]